jgi:hypothetical protein
MARAAASSGLLPAAARRPETDLSPQEATLSDAAIDAFTVALGGRQQLLDTLLVAESAPDVARITTLLIDPRYGGKSLRWICHHAHLTIAELFAAYQKALIVKAHLQATHLVADQLLGVVDDVMRRSQPHEVSCEDCAGRGQVTPAPTKAQPNPAPGPCASCGGRGQVTRLPDLDRQKVALELGQLLQRSGGINLQQNLIAPPPSASPLTAPGTLEQLQHSVREIFSPPPAAVEGQVVPPAAEERDEAPVP